MAGLLTPLGMVGFNWLADRGGRRIAAMLAYGCSLGGLGALALVRGPADDLWLWLFVALFGCSVGSRGPMISTLVTLRYRGANLGRIYGLISVGMGLGGFARRLDRRRVARSDRRLHRRHDLLGAVAPHGGGIAHQRSRRPREALLAADHAGLSHAGNSFL